MVRNPFFLIPEKHHTYRAGGSGFITSLPFTELYSIHVSPKMLDTFLVLEGLKAKVSKFVREAYSKDSPLTLTLPLALPLLIRVVRGRATGQVFIYIPV